MGEWSKKIGEYGESIVDKFLCVIGWKNPAKGIQIPCRTRGHKSTTSHQAETHGIDFFFSYKNPFVSDQLNNVIISSKFMKDKYPNSATALFKSHMSDLINTVECFDKSDFKTDILQTHKQFGATNDIGVLFWLNQTTEKDANDDLISVVANAKLDIVIDRTIYIMDNKRVAFVLSLMNYVKSLTNYDYTFFYPSIGQNINPITRSEYGSILPVEYINSSVIPFRLENKDKKEILIFLGCIDDFTQDTFMRMLGLAKDLSKGWTSGVVIGFHDYNDLDHKNIVSITNQGFAEPEFTEKVKVINYFNLQNVF